MISFATQSEYNTLLKAAREKASAKVRSATLTGAWPHVEVLDKSGIRFAIKMVQANTRLGYKVEHYVDGKKVGGLFFMDCLAQVGRSA